jgi:hypothetical protein
VEATRTRPRATRRCAVIAVHSTRRPEHDQGDRAGPSDAPLSSHSVSGLLEASEFVLPHPSNDATGEMSFVDSAGVSLCLALGALRTLKSSPRTAAQFGTLAERYDSRVRAISRSPTVTVAVPLAVPVLCAIRRYSVAFFRRFRDGGPGQVPAARRAGRSTVAI